MNPKNDISRYDYDDVRRAIDGICSLLQLKLDAKLQQEFEAGLHPRLLSYEKIQSSEKTLPILEKYLIGASTFLHQPCNYYDIFRIGRCVAMIQGIHESISELVAKKAINLVERLKRLRRETIHDSFDAVAFELITAAKYSKLPGTSHIEFLIESDKMTPDFSVKYLNLEFHVECKKIDRTQNYTILIRDSVRDILNKAIERFKSQGDSVLAEVDFKCDPRDISESRITEALYAAYKNRTAIIEPNFTVFASSLPRREGDDYTLHPSAFFYWNRYGFRIRSEWFGLIHQMFGSMARRGDLPKELQGGRSSWLHRLEWDSAIKWKISSEKVVAKYRRFGFDGVFKGLTQIQHSNENSCVHLWLESDYYVGNRRNTMRDLYNRIVTNQTHSFGWLIINETMLDVSPKGYFDLVEQAYMIRGPKSAWDQPLVSGVFAPEISKESGEFGIGLQAPDIDELR